MGCITLTLGTVSLQRLRCTNGLSQDQFCSLYDIDNPYKDLEQIKLSDFRCKADILMMLDLVLWPSTVLNTRITVMFDPNAFLLVRIEDSLSGLCGVVDYSTYQTGLHSKESTELITSKVHNLNSQIVW